MATAAAARRDQAELARLGREHEREIQRGASAQSHRVRQVMRPARSAHAARDEEHNDGESADREWERLTALVVELGRADVAWTPEHEQVVRTEMDAMRLVTGLGARTESGDREDDTLQRAAFAQLTSDEPAPEVTGIEELVRWLRELREEHQTRTRGGALARELARNASHLSGQRPGRRKRRPNCSRVGRASADLRARPETGGEKPEGTATRVARVPTAMAGENRAGPCVMRSRGGSTPTTSNARSAR